MTDLDIGRFSIRAMTRRELARQGSYTRHMLLASAAASLAIVGAGAFFISLWF